MKKVIALIPARGKSKRIPMKNVMDFMGKPMIYWTILAARESNVFDEILVSTDSEEIAKVARECGATVPFLRDRSDADDFTPVWIATTNALIRLENYHGVKYDIVVQLMPNCPLRDSSDIQSAYETFIANGSPFQISVFKFGWMNPWWAMTVDSNSMKPTRIFPYAFKKRSQDLAILYCPTGAIWIAQAKELKRQKTFYGEGYTVFPIDWRHAIDIDDNDDVRMAEVVANLSKTDTTSHADLTNKPPQ